MPTPGTLTEPGLVIYRFGVGIFYANSERLSEEVLGLVDVEKPPHWFVLDADAIDDIDYTGGKTLCELVDQLPTVAWCFAAADASCDSIPACRRAWVRARWERRLPSMRGTPSTRRRLRSTGMHVRCRSQKPCCFLSSR